MLAQAPQTSVLLTTLLTIFMHLIAHAFHPHTPHLSDAELQSFYQSTINTKGYTRQHISGYGVVNLDNANSKTHLSNVENLLPGRYRRAYFNPKGTPWPNGEYHYAFDSRIKPLQKELVLEAMKNISREAPCIHFIPVTERRDDMIIHSGGDQHHCYASTMGYKPGHVIVYMGKYCDRNVVAHEMLHVLGAIHTQNRPDRDEYVDIHWDNIKEDFRKQFKKVKGKTVHPRPGKYDFLSAMHYPSFAFGKSSDEPSLSPLNEEVRLLNHGHLPVDEEDYRSLREWYGCCREADDCVAGNDAEKEDLGDEERVSESEEGISETEDQGQGSSEDEEGSTESGGGQEEGTVEGMEEEITVEIGEGSTAPIGEESSVEIGEENAVEIGEEEEEKEEMEEEEEEEDSTVEITTEKKKRKREAKRDTTGVERVIQQRVKVLEDHPFVFILLNKPPVSVQWMHENGTTLSPTSISNDGTVEMLHVPVANVDGHNGTVFLTLVDLTPNNLLVEWTVDVLREESILARDIVEP